MTISQPEAILVTTLYGRDNRIPMVQIEVPRGKVQMTVEEAEDLARNLVHACEASLTDAFLIEFFQQPDFGLKDDHLWGIIRDFRQWREARIARPPEGAVDA